MTASNQVKLKPGDTIGILGGGQLGRMLAMAAARLGLRCQVFSPDPDSPAFDVVLNATCAEYADVEALELFANDVDVITYEFENVPAASAMILAARRPVLPDRKILETTQDRLAEKDFVTRLGIGTADYADVSSAEALRHAIARIGLPAVLKTRRFGYDGKGQAIIRSGDDPDLVWENLATKSAILEAFIPFEREISVIAARSADGQVECFDVTENEHSDHILKISRAPAAVSDALAAQARGIAERIAHALNYVGVLAVEMFVVQGDRGAEGAGQRNRTTGAQFRALDAGRRLDLAVRAACPRHCRLAARQAGPSWPGHHDQFDRGRYQRLRAMADGAGRDPASVRQGTGAAGPQDGPCDAGRAAKDPLIGLEKAPICPGRGACAGGHYRP